MSGFLSVALSLRSRKVGNLSYGGVERVIFPCGIYKRTRCFDGCAGIEKNMKLLV